MQRIYTLNEIEYIANELLVAAKGNVLLFYGNMGVGKTTLIKTLAKLIGVSETVSSPTFSLVNEYRTVSNQPVYHFDFYRINQETEALDMGVDEYFDSGAYCLVEWPEKIKNILPLDAISIFLTELPDGTRKLEMV